MQNLTKEQILGQIENNTFEVHQSRLKNLLGDFPFRFLEVKNDEPSEAMIMGNLVETILLEEDQVEERFEIVRDMPPKGIVADMIRNVNEENICTKLNMEDQKDKWLELANSQNLGGGRWGEETVFRKVQEHQKYWEYLRKRDKSKSPVSLEFYEEAQAVAAGLASSPVSCEYFKRTKNQEIIVQYTFSWEYLDVPCSGIADIVLVDLVNKTIRIIDVKTTRQGWRRAARNFRWDIQGAFYTLALSEDPIKKYKDFEILPPLFIISHLDYPSNPVVKCMSEKDLIHGQFGVIHYTTLDFRGGMPLNLPSYTTEGFHDLIERYKFHQTMGNWDKRREFFDDDYTDYLNIY